MSKNIKITKGLDIKLKGDAEKVFVEIPPSETVAIKPTDFPGLRPKLAIKVGEEVKAGTTLFFDKDNENINNTNDNNLAHSLPDLCLLPSCPPPARASSTPR